MQVEFSIYERTDLKCTVNKITWPNGNLLFPLKIPDSLTSHKATAYFVAQIQAFPHVIFIQLI